MPFWKRIPLFVLILAVVSGSVGAGPAERVYLACDDHTDYYWSADAATYRQAFLEMIDYYLQRIDATESAPSDYQARFNCDGSLWLWEYERHRPPDQFVKLTAALAWQVMQSLPLVAT